MCTTISTKLAISGSGKGANGWFVLDHAYVGYDHPTQAPVEHAVLLDFVNESSGPGARVAVELDLESARDLVRHLTEALAAADAYEGHGRDTELSPAEGHSAARSAAGRAG